jgi:acetyl-CoA acetyltransferase
MRVGIIKGGLSIMDDVVIVGGARTAIGDFMGSKKDVSAVELGISAVMGALINALSERRIGTGGV